MRTLTKIILSLLLCGSILLAQSYHTITIDGSNDFNDSYEGFDNISHDGASGQKAYFTWDAYYVYFGIFDAEADFDNLATFMYFDVDPGEGFGTSDGYAWSENIQVPFQADYVVVWKNYPGASYIEVMEWNDGTFEWDRVASANSNILSGDYDIRFAIGTDYREIRIKRENIGSPSKIKFCSFTEQQWGNYWRYFAFPSGGSWVDQNRGSNQSLDHFVGFTLSSGYNPNDDNSLDYVMRKNYGFLYFDGVDEYVKYTNDTYLQMLDGAQAYTLEAWIYPRSDKVADGDFFINRLNSFSFIMYDENGDSKVQDWYFRIWDAGNNSWVNYDTQGDSTLKLDAWNHVAVINDPLLGTLKLYVNGNDVTDNSGYVNRDLPPAQTSNNLYIGAKQATTPNNSFGGYIDEVRFQANAYEIGQLHTSQGDNAYNKDQATAVLFHFDEGSGTTTLNGANYIAATLNNGVSWVTTTTSLPFPVELTSFTANISGSIVKLNWRTATEINNYGFEIQRATENSDWQKIGFVEGAGNSNSPKEYSFTDNIGKSGKYSYRLKQIDINGEYKYSQVVEIFVGLPTKFELKQNYPNPFNPTTNIKYSIGKKTKVTLKVYDMLGREIATLINKEQTPGNYAVEFDALSLSSGVYFYTLKAGEFTATKKMILMK